MLLQPCHVLCRNNNIDDLDNFGRLNPDTGKSNPAVVACAAVGAEKDQCNQKGNVDAAQKLPLFSQKIGVNECQNHKSTEPEKQRKNLNDDTFDGTVNPSGRLHGDCGDPYHIDPEK